MSAASACCIAGTNTVPLRSRFRKLSGSTFFCGCCVCCVGFVIVGLLLSTSLASLSFFHVADNLAVGNGGWHQMMVQQRGRYDIEKMSVDGEDVCPLYNFVTEKATRTRAWRMRTRGWYRRTHRPAERSSCRGRAAPCTTRFEPRGGRFEREKGGALGMGAAEWSGRQGEEANARPGACADRRTQALRYPLHP